MTTYSKATLKTFFEQNDIPTGTDYANFIDSYVNIVETGLQSMAGALFTPELNATLVSANNFNMTGSTTFNGTQFTITTLNSMSIVAGNNISLLAANNVIVSAANSVIVSANTISLNSVTGVTINNNSGSSISMGSNLVFTGGGNITLNASNGIFFTDWVTVSALRVNANVSAVAVYATGGFLGLTGITSAAGTAQGTAAPLINITTRAKGVVDGVTTGFALPANKTGLTQYIYNDAVSANLWPPTGGTINALAGNAAFPMAASTLYTIVHIAASAYAVK